MTNEPRAFFALDLGSATSSAALVGHVGERWRLVAHLAVPALADPEPLLLQLARRVRRADRELFAELAAGDGVQPAEAVASWPRLQTSSSPARRLAVLASSRRQRHRLEEAAGRAGWLVTAGSAEEDDPLRLSRLALSPDTDALLLGADEPPAGDERRRLQMVAALASAAARRRPELQVVLSGGATAAAAEVHNATLAPDAAAGQPGGEPLRRFLEDIRVLPGDGRVAIARAVASLAFVLDRTVEAVEIGLQAGLRCRAEPVGEAHASLVTAYAIVAMASFAPLDPSPAIVDGVLSWATMPVERYRLSDRLRDLRTGPWAESDGDGALFRLAAARAAVERLVAATPDLSAHPMPDLLVASGGVWSAVPPPVVSLALADVVRRSGLCQLALDQARLLGPLGTIEDETERRRILSDLSDDLLVPLGSLVLPAGLRHGRSAGRLHVRSATAGAEMDLEPGGIEIVDLPPGEIATAELDFRDTVRLGARGRHFAGQVTGGLGGLLVDLRDVPLRLPERPDQRRSVLERWQRPLWREAGE